jgi:hypothetical protein
MAEVINKLPPLIEESGRLEFGTWIIKIRSDYEELDEVLRATPKQLFLGRELEILLTFFHEAVHFYQGLSSSFLLNYAKKRIALFGQIGIDFKNQRISYEYIRDVKEKYEKILLPLLDKANHGISVISLLEAQAITESVRVLDFDNDVNQMLVVLENYYPGEGSVYRAAIEYVAMELDLFSAYRLLPKIVFVCLNTDSPVETFIQLVGKCKQIDAPNRTQLSVRSLKSLIGIHGLLSIPNRYKDPVSEFRQFWLAEYWQFMSTIGDDDFVAELMATPGEWMNSPYSMGLKDFAPPFVLCSGGKGSALGLGKRIVDSLLRVLIHLDGINGLFESLLTQDLYYNACPHTECPVYETNLCHDFLPISMKLNWQECGFHDTVVESLGMSVQEVIETWNRLSSSPV